MEQQNRNSKQNPSGNGKKPAPKSGAGGSRSAAGKPYARGGAPAGSRGDRVRISAEQRRRRKKRRDAFLVAVMVLMLAAVAVILSTTVFFKAADVIVNNQMEMYSEEVIIDASGLKAGDNMFTANLEKAAAAIEKQLPYIRVASVRRKWPDTFFIDAEYTDTVLAVRKGGAYIYIDPDGKVLETDVAQPEETAAVVEGAYADSAVPGTPVAFTDEKTLNNLLTVVAAVTQSGIRNVTAYDIGNPTDVVIEIEGRVEVKLGSVSTVAGKIEFGREVIARSLAEDSGKSLVIDLTAGAKAFVRDKDAPAGPVSPTDPEPPEDGEEADQGEDGEAPDEDSDGDDDEDDDEDRGGDPDEEDGDGGEAG